MHPIDALVRGLRADAPPHAPAIPVPLRWRVPALLLAAVLLAAVLPGVLQPADPARVGSRGAPVMSAPLDLRMLVERDGVAMRITDGAVAFVGERVYFRGAGPEGARLQLSVTEPHGEVLLKAFDATASGVDVRTEHGLLAYEFEAPGEYIFALGDDVSTPATIAIRIR